MKRFSPFLIVAGTYLLVSACLLSLGLNWFALHIWYVLSWPASHFFARESLPVQVVFGCLQYILLAAVWVIFIRRKHGPK